MNLTLSSTKPTRTGYTFLGWATSSSATSATYSAGGTYSNNVAATLYAVWKANTYLPAPGEALRFGNIPIPDKTATVYAVLYDASGKMLGIKQFSALEMDTASITVSQRAKTAKLIFLDSDLTPTGKAEVFTD